MTGGTIRSLCSLYEDRGSGTETIGGPYEKEICRSTEG